ncbi:MAG: phasin family protein [Burkholderiaceae bacterium]
MTVTPAQLTEMQKGQMDAFFALSQTMFNATERLVELNMATAKASVEESVEKAQALMSAKDAQEFLALSGSLAQPSIEKLVSYSRTVYGITNGASMEVSRIVESQIAEGNKTLAQAIDAVAKSAPAGSEPAVAMFKSAVAAANTAYDTFNKATKHVVEAAESNLAAATHATMKAAAATETAQAAPRSKKA